MQLVSTFLTTLVLTFLTLQPIAMATNAVPDPVPASKALTKEKKEALPHVKVAIVPHRAVYTMSLASVKNGGNITGVSGKLAFEWNDVCDGWAVQQHLQLHFNYAQGDESDVTSSEISWESKDGKSYNFNIHHSSNGKETEYYRGKAALNQGIGHVVYTVPKDRQETLPTGTLFPSTHTTLILQNALPGERFFTRRVFDGTDEEGSSDVSVFINSPILHIDQTETDVKLKASPLLNQVGWPVRMAFFKADSATGEPDYEMDLTILANGVVDKMRIDYGDFTVIGTLREIQALPASGC